MFSIIELTYLIKILNYYKPGLVKIIEYYINTYTFIDNKQLKDAVDIWCESQNEGLNNYGEINYWNVSNITNMTNLFKNKIDFNDKIDR